MIKIDFKEPNDKAWTDWKAQCQSVQQRHNKAIASDEKPKVNPKIYKGEDFNIKFTVYFNRNSPFSGKCAFCESDVLVNQPGDIEHYRPKAALKDKDDNDIMVDIDGVTQPHPGYYWLAYDWKNFLPSCRDCNSRTKSKTNGEWIGKGNLFPVKDSHAVKAGHHFNEKPLIINPVYVDPSNHLWVDKLGFVHAYTDEGRTSIEIFGLNKREGLITARKDAYDEAKAKTKMYIISMEVQGSNLNELHEQLELIKKGKKPYSLAAIQAIKDAVDEHDEKLKRLRDISNN